MEDAKIFKTKTGFCHIFPDQLVLSKNAVIDSDSEVPDGSDEIAQIVIVYGAMSAILFYLAFQSYQKEHPFLPFVLGILTLFPIYGIVSGLLLSYSTVIPRQNSRRCIKESKTRNHRLSI